LGTTTSSSCRTGHFAIFRWQSYTSLCHFANAIILQSNVIAKVDGGSAWIFRQRAYKSPAEGIEFLQSNVLKWHELRDEGIQAIERGQLPFKLALPVLCEGQVSINCRLKLVIEVAVVRQLLLLSGLEENPAEAID